MKPMTFVTFLWNDGFRSYLPEHVNLLAHAIQYFYPEPHRFVCLTDDLRSKRKFSDAVEVIKIPPESSDMGRLSAPQGNGYPSSYRRLWLFSEAAKDIGDKIMLLDVDCFVVGDLRPLVQTEGDFVGWRPRKAWGNEKRIGGGTWMLNTGTQTHVWEEFSKDPQKMIEHCKAMGWNGSDQAILSHFFSEGKIWDKNCGILGAQDGVFTWNYPPKEAKIVHCNGKQKGWSQDKLWMAAYNEVFQRSPERTIDDFYADPECRTSPT